MRKLFWLSAIGCVAALAIAQGSGSALLQAFGQALQDSKSLKATFTLQRIGDPASTYELSFSKPNQLRVDTPTESVVADGAKVTVYDKSTKTYFSDPQTEGSVAAILNKEGVGLWSAFFDAKAFESASAKSLGTKSSRGTEYQLVEASFKGGEKTVTFYLDGQRIAQRAEIQYRDTGADKALLMITKSVELGGEMDESLFAFTPPAGSREVTLEERTANRWYESLDEGLAVAKRTGKLVMIDFAAVW